TRLLLRSAQSKLEAGRPRRSEGNAVHNRSVIQLDCVDVRFTCAQAAGAEIEDPLLTRGIPTERRIVISRGDGLFDTRNRSVVDPGQHEAGDYARGAYGNALGIADTELHWNCSPLFPDACPV